MAHIDLTDAERDVLAALCEAAVESNFDSGDMMRLLFKACELRDYEAIRAALEKLGLEPMKNSTAQADQLVLTEYKRWEDIVKRLDIKQD